MPDLNFHIDHAKHVSFAAAPTLAFVLRIDDAEPSPRTIQSVALRCQIRIEPTRRQYEPAEKERLLDLFGTPDRWGQTLRSMLWTHAGLIVPSFTAETKIDLPVPCSFDFNIAATKYFDAVSTGEIPLVFLFSGTVFYFDPDDQLQAEQISWEKESNYRLPASVWRAMMDEYYPNSAWLNLRKDIFDRLNQYKMSRAMPTWEKAIESLLASADHAADQEVAK